MMKTFEFSIIASGVDPEADDFGDRFYDAGCDDALVAYQKGHIILDFAREADTIVEAVASAIENVRAAGAVVDRIEPDPLVSLADIAERTGLTRAAISNYFKGSRGKNFPAPVAKVTSDSPLWDWAAVAHWMAANQKVPVELSVEACVLKEANAAIGAGEVHLADRLKRRAQQAVQAFKVA
ncbi:helix-turn-helix transcriptional regulator [Bradyrhizobium sp. SZCCHNR2032]|uniref:helix-turn-helix transcriptional regulator n=2 Tax=Bradyrhizobium TaxID=374 RepID=UPI0029163013|nr:helix-turn-helix transcriptional regulator [Bradyrhizobium sp. SZCCHNR2032]